MVNYKQVFNGCPCHFTLPGPRITLDTHWTDDLNCYLDWIRNPEVNKYLVKGGVGYTRDELKAFIDDSLAAADRLFFRVVENKSKRHVGNFMLNKVDLKAKECGLGLLIGETSCRGKGYGAEACRVALTFAATVLDMYRIYFEVAVDNRPAVDMYLRLGCRSTNQLRSIATHSFSSMEVDVFEITRDTIIGGFSDV